MHLKVLVFGLLTLGLASASPKAEAKPEPKASPQLFQGYPNVQPSYFGQQYSVESYPGLPSAGPHNVRSYESFENPFGGYQYYSQGPAVNYYQAQQRIPVPVAYPASQVQSSNYYGAGRLWPKTLVSPTGTPSPAPEASQVFYPSSTPSPVAYQSLGNSFFGSTQIASSTPPSVVAAKPIPVPVKVDSRNSFQPESINYSVAPQSAPVPVSTPASFVASYQQSTPAPFVQSTPAVPYAAFQQQVTSAPYVQYQQPTAAPLLANNYQQYYSSPFKYSYQQQSTPAPPKVSYEQNTKIPYQATYQVPAISSRTSFPTYQKQPTAASFVAQYQQPAGSLYQANYQALPVPVGVPQYQYQSQPAQSTLTHHVASYPSVPVQSQPISIVPPTSPPVKTVTITEKPFNPTPTPSPQAKATVIKSEYNPGYVSPQYNQISQYSTPSPVTHYSSPSPVSPYSTPSSVSQYSTPSPFLHYSTQGSASHYSSPSPFASGSSGYLSQPIGNAAYGYSYVPSKAYASYSPSTAVSHVSYNGLGHSYNY